MASVLSSHVFTLYEQSSRQIRNNSHTAVSHTIVYTGISLNSRARNLLTYSSPTAQYFCVSSRSSIRQSSALRSSSHPRQVNNGNDLLGCEFTGNSVLIQQSIMRSRSDKKSRNRSGLSCRAADLNYNLLEALQGGDRVESDKLPPTIREATMKAVEELGGRVTVGDVAAKVGVSVIEAERSLKAIAADTGGFLEVSDEGDVLYVLQKGFRNALVQKSVRIKLEPIWEKVKGAAEYIARVSFGTALLASIALVYTTIVIALTSSRSEDRRDRGGGGGYYVRSSGQSFFNSPSLYFNPLDALWYWDPLYYRNRRVRREEGKTMGFFEGVFSFVFGDGDPNEGAEERRWRSLGDFIAQKGGVVTAEELAPFLNPPPLTDGMDDEAYVLPVLQRFDGMPEVDDTGNILYVFPSLQKTASDWLGRSRVQINRGAPPGEHFQEESWKFSEADKGQQALAVGLGFVNFVGVIFAAGLLRDQEVVRQIGSSIVSFTASIMPFLQAYAVSFFAIPALRWFILQRRNAVIMARNKARLDRAMLLVRASPALRRKLLNARERAQSNVIGRDRVIYTTERDLSEQDLEAAEWEKRLREISEAQS